MNNTRQQGSIGKLLLSILICQATGIISGLLSVSGRDGWFDVLVKPAWNPPGYLFGPVWTVLYLLMGIALWLVWKSQTPQPQKKKAILLFAVQLFLNFWWSLLFFKLHSPAFALVDIVVLWVLIVLTLVQFAKLSKPAAWLLVPYLLWVSFATVLNYTIWSLN